MVTRDQDQPTRSSTHGCVVPVHTDVDQVVAPTPGAISGWTRACPVPVRRGLGAQYGSGQPVCEMHP